MRKRTTSNTDTSFTCVFNNGDTKEIPFRVGDLVMIKDWGGIYDFYQSAFVHFTGSKKSLHYCYYHNRNIPSNKLFKVMGIAEHGSFHDILCYIIDNERRGAVIEASYLKPFKVYPLRQGEKSEIKLKKIQQI
ncbi:MAG: hypothetical protein J6O49_04890 [Bacteroidaceae bacterium]|nr:hypothetical protein [Bacteroidaceae bacterium]